jgi:hypothetical protein
VLCLSNTDPSRVEQRQLVGNSACLSPSHATRPSAQGHIPDSLLNSTRIDFRTRDLTYPLHVHVFPVCVAFAKVIGIRHPEILNVLVLADIDRMNQAREVPLICFGNATGYRKYSVLSSSLPILLPSAIALERKTQMLKQIVRKTVFALAMASLLASSGRVLAQSTSSNAPAPPSPTSITGTDPEPQGTIISIILTILQLA